MYRITVRTSNEAVSRKICDILSEQFYPKNKIFSVSFLFIANVVYLYNYNNIKLIMIVYCCKTSWYYYWTWLLAIKCLAISWVSMACGPWNTIIWCPCVCIMSCMMHAAGNLVAINKWLAYRLVRCFILILYSIYSRSVHPGSYLASSPVSLMVSMLHAELARERREPGKLYHVHDVGVDLEI
jgi:hypothetical protein